MNREINDLDFVRASRMGEAIARAGSAGYWLDSHGIRLDTQRKAIKDALHELAALHGLVLVDANPHAADADLKKLATMEVDALLQEENGRLQSRVRQLEGAMKVAKNQARNNRVMAAIATLTDNLGNEAAFGARDVMPSHAADAALAGIKSVQS